MIDGFLGQEMEWAQGVVRKYGGGDEKQQQNENKNFVRDQPPPTLSPFACYKEPFADGGEQAGSSLKTTKSVYACYFLWIVPECLLKQFSSAASICARAWVVMEV